MLRFTITDMMQDSDNQAAINRLFGVEQHTSLRNEESGESIEVSLPEDKKFGCFHLCKHPHRTRISCWQAACAICTPHTEAATREYMR